MARRRGYSLVEILAVLAVMVVAFFLALPAIQPMMADNDLQAASDLVQARWTEMRTRAMADGQPYRFAVMENAGSFRIAPDSPEFWGENGNSSGSAEERPPWVVEEKLPGKILFTCAKVTSAGNDPSEHSQAEAGGAGWTRALTFLPNGTARENVHVSFGKTGSPALTLSMRGLTGQITAEEDSAGKGSHP